jgi:tungstate transport system permease protein
MDYIRQGLIQALFLLYEGDPDTYSAIWVTLRVSTASILVSLAAGIPAGFFLGHFRFPGRRGVRLVVDTLLSLPTVLIGLIVYSMLSRQGPLGAMGLLYTLPAISVGQVILGLPIIIALTASAVENLDKRLSAHLLTLGAGRRQLLSSTIWEARFSLVAAAVTAYGRIVSEVGISMMVGGNIKWHTRTITTAIALETNKGRFSFGIALGLVLLMIAFLTNMAVSLLRKRARS